MTHVARRHLQRGLDGFVRDAHRVVPLEPGPQVVQDRPGLLDRRLGHVDGPEAAGERLVFLDELLVLALRGGADDPHLAAGEHRLEHVRGVRRRAQRGSGPDHRVHLVDEQDQVRALLDLADDVLDPILEHPAEHRPGHHRVHLQVDDLAVAQANGHCLRLELDPARDPLRDGGLAHARLAEQEHRVRALPVAEHFEDAVHLGVPAEYGRQLVLPRELVQVGGEVFEKRRQLEALLQPLFAQLVIAHAGRQTRHQRVGLDAVPADDRDGDPLRLFEDGREEVGRFDRVAAAAARMQQRQLEEELGRRRHTQFPAGDARQQPQVLLEGLQNLVRIQLEVAHDVAEHVPLGLRERQADVLIGQQCVLAPARLFQRAIHHPLGRIGHLALRNVEVVLFHGALHAKRSVATSSTAISAPTFRGSAESRLTVWERTRNGRAPREDA